MRDYLTAFFLCWLGLPSSISMDRIANFSKAWQEFAKNPHVAHASYSITILDSHTGSVLYEHDKDVGLASASTLKTITAAAALHYLGPNYTYETLLQYSGDINPATGFLDGYIYIVGSGDPSLGSWRYDETTTADFIIGQWIEAIKRAGIKKCRGIVGDTSRWNHSKTMLIDGWTWNDIGHWYGTGHSALNWRENEFTIEIQPGTSRDAAARIVTIKHPPPRLQLINQLVTSPTAEEPSLYFTLDGSNIGYLRGTVPPDAPPDYNMRCAVPDSALYVADELTRALRMQGIEVEHEATVGSSESQLLTLLYTYKSPSLSKLLEPFLRISINMYGEVFVKTIAVETGQSTLFDAPLKILPKFVETLIDDDDPLAGVATTDGSGLSRSNRLSTYALARILFTLQKQPWFETFYEAFPTINGIRMKSGTLLNTIAYAGYIKDNSFVFSFIINNAFGYTAPEMRQIVWKMLDTLK